MTETGKRTGVVGASGEVRLTQLRVGDVCRVLRVERKGELLAGFCIYPGARLELRQRFPAVVVAAEGLEFGLETDLAHGVWVEPTAPANPND